jgi:hypothetical protein
MKFYGIELAAGTTVQDLVCEGGIVFPTTNLMQGRLFYNSTTLGLYVYDGNSWSHLASGNNVFVTSVNGRVGDVNIQTSDITDILPTASSTQLGAIKVGNGLTIDNAGILSAAVTQSSIPAGSRLLWAQPIAPVGWTQVSDITTNNRMLRVVSVASGSVGNGGTGGGGYGGNADPTIMNVVPSHTHIMNGSTSAVGDHAHSQAGYNLVGGGGGIPWYNWANNSYATNMPNTGLAGAHSHTISATIDANTGASNWTPQYLNLILCSKD